MESTEKMMESTEKMQAVRMVLGAGEKPHSGIMGYCARLCGGYTFMEHEGGWIAPDGSLVVEPSWSVLLVGSEVSTAAAAWGVAEWAISGGESAVMVLDLGERRIVTYTKGG